MKRSVLLTVYGVLACVIVMSHSYEISAQLQRGMTNPRDNPKKADCMYWQALVDKSVTKPDDNQPIDESDTDTAMQGMRCLLTLEGNKNPARFSGAIRTDVSQTFDETTADVAALYYVSYLYTGRFDHARAVALRDPNSGRFNTEEAIDSAFRAYRKWFRRVERIGLQEARRRGLDPLKGSATNWY